MKIMNKNQCVTDGSSINVSNLAEFITDKLEEYISNILNVYTCPSNGKRSNGRETLAFRRIMSICFGRISINKKSDDDVLNKKIEWVKEVLVWGGIHGNKEETIKDYAINAYENFGKYRTGIASWSKILAFQDLDKYFIYDYRVSFALNYMLSELPNDEVTKYFFMPPSRRANAKEARQKLINKIRAKINKDIVKGSVKLNIQDSYRSYLQLIKEVVKCINEKRERVNKEKITGQMVEMSLFMIFQCYEQSILHED